MEWVVFFSLVAAVVAGYVIFKSTEDAASVLDKVAEEKKEAKPVVKKRATRKPAATKATKATRKPAATKNKK